MERTTVRLPKALLDRARKKAAAEGRTLTSLIEEGLRVTVDAKPKAVPRRKVVLPRCSNAKGGLAPGIDPNRVFQSAEEMDDLEYIERLKNGFK